MFEDIISKENLLEAWREFLKGKRSKKDVQEFSLNLFDNISKLHIELLEGKYKHGEYTAFKISDPKSRNIHKAPVRDRLLHHAIYRKLYSVFDSKFISDSFSCRNKKGTHKAIKRFRYFANKVGKNNTKQCWVLKCDIRKFFASIDHGILIFVIQKYIRDERIVSLCKEIIQSFETEKGIGLPLGNLTSQLFANVYMNEFDQFVKHKLKIKYYLRYADDFVIFSKNRKMLEEIIFQINLFLNNELNLGMHSKKIFIKTIGSGVGFLGWVIFNKHRVLRTSTKRRMLGKVRNSSKLETLNSYLGLLKHGNAYKLQKKIEKIYSD